MDAARPLLEPPGAPENDQTRQKLQKHLMHPKPGHRGEAFLPPFKLPVSSLSLQPPASSLSPQPANPSLHAPSETQKTTKPDRKMPHPRSFHPRHFQSSQATVLELWASPDLLRTPWSQLDISLSNLETPQTHTRRPNLTGKCLSKVVIQASSRALQPLFWSSGLPLTS